MKLKLVPDYVPVDPASNGGPKYGHYAELDPHFAASKAGADAVMATLWNADDWQTFRNNWKAEAPLPEGTPKPGVDVVEAYKKIPVRDGSEIEIKIMKAATNTSADNACVIRYHGGGWAIGGHGSEAVENLHAASHPNVVLVSVDYRLAPEHPFPTPFDDCFDAFRWVRASSAELKISPDRIILLGGSAGSNLALAVALKAHAEGNTTGIQAMLLDWPTGSHPRFFQQLRDRDGYELESYVQCYDATVTTTPIMEFFLDAYLPPTADLKPDPYHSPLLADSFKGLPRAFLQIAGFDPLRDEGLAVAEKLQKDGVPVELHVYKGLPHAFSMLFANLPQSKEYQCRQNAYLDKVVKSLWAPCG